MNAPATDPARKRVFVTRWNLCRECGGSGRIEGVQRVRTRDPSRRGAIRTVQLIESRDCARCKGRGRRFEGLAGALIELAYAAIRPYAKTWRRSRDGRFRASLFVKASTANTLREEWRAFKQADLTKLPFHVYAWRILRKEWTAARAESREQIKLIAAEFRSKGG